MIDISLLNFMAGHEYVRRVAGLGAMVRHRQQLGSVFACPVRQMLLDMIATLLNMAENYLEVNWLRRYSLASGSL